MEIVLLGLGGQATFFSQGVAIDIDNLARNGMWDFL